MASARSGLAESAVDCGASVTACASVCTPGADKRAEPKTKCESAQFGPKSLALSQPIGSFNEGSDYTEFDCYFEINNCSASVTACASVCTPEVDNNAAPKRKCESAQFGPKSLALSQPIGRSDEGSDYTECDSFFQIDSKRSALASARSGLAASAVGRGVSVNKCANACTPVCNSDAKPSGSIICDAPSLTEFDSFFSQSN